MSTQLAIINVSIIPIATQAILSGHDVVIHDDRIVSIRPHDASRKYDGHEVIDGSNKFLMPGLSDMHVHFAEKDDLFLFLAHGVTSVRNMWGWPLHLSWKKEISQKKILGPRIYTSGPLVDASPPAWNGSITVTSPEEAERVVDSHLEQGFDFIKVYSMLDQETYHHILHAAEKRNIPVDGHIPFAISVKQALNSTHRCAEHLLGYYNDLQTPDSPYIDKFDRPSRMHKMAYLDESKFAEYAQLTKDGGLWNCPTFEVLYKVYGTNGHREKIKQAPEMAYVPPLARASWSPEHDFRHKQLVESDHEVFEKHMLTIKRFVLELHEKGAGLLAGTDAPNPYVIPGYSLHDELAHFVDAGLSTYDTLKIATLKAAEFMNINAGSVEEGKLADLLLLHENPLDAIGNTRKIAGVVAGGQWLSKEMIDAKLKEQVASYDTKQAVEPFPEMSTQGNIIFNKIYDITYNSAPLGKEQIAVTRNGGVTTITCSHRVQGLEEVCFDVQLTLDETEEIKMMNVKSCCQHPKVEISFSLEDGQLEVTHDKSSTKIPSITLDGKLQTLDVSTSPMVSGFIPMLANFIVLRPIVKRLAVGQVETVQSKELEIYPFMNLFDAEHHITRNDDVMHDGKNSYSFTITKTKRNASARYHLVLNENYFPETLESFEQLGVIRFK